MAAKAVCSFWARVGLAAVTQAIRPRRWARALSHPPDCTDPSGRNIRPSDKETGDVSSPEGALRTGGARRTECDPAATDRPPRLFRETAHVSVVAMIDSTGSAIYAALNGLA